MTTTGLHVWQDLAKPKIHSYYQQALSDFTVNDTVHTLHYLLRMLDNMKRLDTPETEDSTEASPLSVPELTP
jgi:hypothetical protein